MRRRSLLAAAATAAGGSLAGCLGAGRFGCHAERDADAQPGATPASTPNLPVPESAFVRSTPRDSIPAITDPAFGPDWTGLELTGTWWGTGEEFSFTVELDAGDPVVGVERDGRARAYPLAVLNWHEVVNDEFDGPLLVTYCPLCGSAITAERTVAGEESQFGVSGLLYRSNLVLYDRLTESLWGQVQATALRGPAAGQTLSLVPSALTDWGSWRRRHPGTEVLLPAPYSKTVDESGAKPYPRDPYEGYRSTGRVVGGASTPEGDALHPKTTVLGVAHGGAAVAYPLPVVAEAGVVNDVVGRRPVVVAAAGERLVAYDRRVDGAVAEFEAVSDAAVSDESPTVEMRALGSRWSVRDGVAVDGPREGTRLRRVADATQLYWFAWREFHPETTRYDPSRRGWFGWGCG